MEGSLQSELQDFAEGQISMSTLEARFQTGEVFQLDKDLQVKNLSPH